MAVPTSQWEDKARRIDYQDARMRRKEQRKQREKIYRHWIQNVYMSLFVIPLKETYFDYW